jgi:hypothetical protein
MNQNRRIFLRNSALLGGAIALKDLAGKAQMPSGSDGKPTHSIEQASDSDSVRRLFQSPPKKFRPIARWWWPGNDVADAELRREIDVLDKAGFGGAEIQSFIKGLDTSTFSLEQLKRLESFATPSFFGHVGVAAEEAANRGMFIDYTFGSGWPFGGGTSITPELASIELRSTRLSIEGPAKFHERLQIPSVTDGDPKAGANILSGLPDGWAERMKKRSRVVAVVAVRGSNSQWDFARGGGRERTVVTPGALDAGTSVDLTSHLQADGTLSWDVPSGTWQLFVFCSVPTLQKVNAGGGEGPEFVMDHMSAEAFAAHSKRVGDDAIPFVGKYFGNGIRAVFCDSLEVQAYLFWSDDFLAEFHRRRDYDLLPYLPILKVQRHSEPYGRFVEIPDFEMKKVGDQVRHDYRLTVSELMTERFYGEFNKWAHQHNLLSRTQAHGSPTAVLTVYGESDIPETEDLYDNGCYDFLKMAASAAHVYGRAIVGSESFVWPNSVYQTTPEKIKLASDELLTAGVNAIVYHGFPYVIPDYPAPGWHPFRGAFGDGNYSSQFNELNLFWPYVAQLNAYITRLQYLSQAGTNVAAVALYFDDLTHGAEETPPTPMLNQALMDAGYNYDHVNAGSLLQCTIQNQMLVTAGGARYAALVLPALDCIDAAVAEKLVSFASGGIPIVFAGQLPAHASGILESDRNTRRVQDAMHKISDFRGVHLATDNDGVISRLKSAVKPNVRFQTGPLSFIQKRIGKINAWFLRNNSDATRRLTASFESEGSPELWDPWTGKSSAMATFKRTETWIEVDLELQPFSSALIVFDPDAAAAPAVAAQSPRNLKRSEEVGASGWKLTATGLVPSGKTAVIQRALPTLIDWSLDPELRGMSGKGVYATTFSVAAPHLGERIILDLGDVKDVAEVRINGELVGTLLLRPYRIDITSSVRSGENSLEIAVTNTLYNCMALREPRSFRAGGTDNPSGLMPSGLIGPVELKIMN